jgi:hypothetical protein
MIRDVHSGSGIRIHHTVFFYMIVLQSIFSYPDLLQTEPEPNNKIHFQLQKNQKFKYQVMLYTAELLSISYGIWKIRNLKKLKEFQNKRYGNSCR